MHASLWLPLYSKGIQFGLAGYKWTLKLLKGKFSSGIEGALASTLNHDFNWKQLSEMILCIFCDVFKVWVTMIQKQQKYTKKETLNFGRGRRTLLWFEI